ncbi:MAG: PAS domain S-box protein, partial [Gloeobacteraceae cyanobacterium ES-bin-316]|nr:PAS domain S-box protein [Ferruginibacter sp.]
TSILECIGTYCGFEYAEAWMVNFDQSHILLNKRWTNNDQVKNIIEADKFIKIKKGEGLAGGAWGRHKVTFVNDITHNSGYLPNKFAQQSQLNSAVFIPVFFKGRSIALLGFYSTQLKIDGNRFKTLFDVFSQQLGPYVQNKKAEDELTRFFNLSPDFMAIAGSDGFFKKINPSFSRILGFSDQELFAKPISSFTHPDDREVTNHKRKSLVEGVPLLNFENRYLTKKGETRWLSWTSTPLPEEGLIFAVAKDTTEKRKLDEERKRILESISDFFFALDRDFNFTYMNQAAEQLFKLAPGALIGKNIWTEWPQLKQGLFFDSAQKSILAKEPVSFEYFDAASAEWFEESIYPYDEGLSVFFRSINERKTAERALNEAFKEKDTILESIGDAFFAVDKNWTVTYWNKMSEQLLKIDRANILGQNLWAIFGGNIADSFFANYHLALHENVSVHFEEYYAPLQVWVEVSAYPSNGGLSVYFKDISTRKMAEDSIRTSNERYDMVAKATNDAIWDWDLITNIVVRPGKRLETLFGYEDCEAKDVDAFWNTHAHPEDWEKVNKKRNALFNNPAENYWEDEYRFLTASGDYGYVHDKGYIIRNHEGKAIRMIGASQDITREKKQVNEIIRIQQNLDSLINTTTDLIWSINTEFKIIAANIAFYNTTQALFGTSIREGDSILSHQSTPAGENKWQAYYAKALSGKSLQIEETTLSRSSGQQGHSIVSFSPIINKDGKISGVACFAKDVTELKRTGQKLQELNISLEKRAEELAASNSELERFAYVASHDLQEPLRMVSSFLQLLEKKYRQHLDETAMKYIHFSVDGAERMK